MPLKGFWLVIIYSVFVFWGCTDPLASTLLSDSTTCAGCSTSTGIASGDISVTPDEPAVAAPVDVSDLVEISGSCQDLNRRNNRILVQVFESEDQSTTPYIDNAINNYCQDSVSTAELRSVVSGASTIQQQCFFITSGAGLSDSSSLAPQYPQCFNGRFSFKVRLGRVMRKDPYIASIDNTTNPITNYLVRVKIRTNEGSTAESAWSNVVVTRYISSPLLTAEADETAIRMKLKIFPAKFRDIRYSIHYTWQGPTNILSVSGTPAAFTNSVSGTLVTHKKPDFPIKSDGTSIDDYWHDGFPLSAAGLMPGMTYTYQITASDFNYTYLTFPGPGVMDSSVSTTVTATIKPAEIKTSSFNASTNSCTFPLSGANSRVGSPFSIEWRYSDTSPTWMTTDPNSGVLLPATTCRSGTTCYVTGGTQVIAPTTSFTAGVRYYFAARSYIDNNGNNQWDAGEFVGEWSPSITASSPAGYVHACIFN